MADVEQRAEAEAAHKGLTGQARASYVGGVFNRIRQAHSRATTPKSGRRNLLRRKRIEDRQEAQNRRDRLRERAAGEAFRLRARTRREEPREKKQEAPSEYTQGEYRAALARHDYEAAVRWGKHISPQAVTDAQRMLDDANKRKRKPAMPPQRPAAPAATAATATGKAAPQAIPRFKRAPLVPIKERPANFQLDATRRVDPYGIREYFGDQQLPRALAMQTEGNLSEAVDVVQERTGKQFDGSRKNRAAMYHWILANM